MTVVTVPPAVAAECAEMLFAIVTTAHRDAATLNRQALALLTKQQHSRPLGFLKKYVGYHGYGADEVDRVIAAIEACMDPEHVKHLARLKVERDRAHAEYLARKKRTRAEHSAIKRALLSQVTATRKEAAKPRQNGNVISGPWDTAG